MDEPRNRCHFRYGFPAGADIANQIGGTLALALMRDIFSWHGHEKLESIRNEVGDWIHGHHVTSCHRDV
jgi:hypothetical protein